MVTKSRYAYVGCRTSRERNARGKGLSVFRVDLNGSLTLVQLLEGLVNPSYLTLNGDGTRLYAVHGDESEVSAFTVDRSSGHLQRLNEQSTQGINPVHLALDPTGKFLVVTNHLSASLAVLPVAEDGSLLPVSQLISVDGPIGPHRIEQTQAKPHYNAFDPSGRFVLVPDKGCDRIHLLRFDAGQLTPCEPSFALSREGAGPRHLAFHPKRPWAYVVNEIDSTVSGYVFGEDTVALRPFQWQSMLPRDFFGQSRAAHVAIDDGGQYLYASNRGHDSIAVFRIHPITGLLELAEITPTQGQMPRSFTISPDGSLLYALNEGSDSIAAFTRDRWSGRLEFNGHVVNTGSPVCMVISPA